MTVTYSTKPGEKATQEQLEEVRLACEKEIEPDEDCPELSDAMIKAFKSATIQRNRRRNA